MWLWPSEAIRDLPRFDFTFMPVPRVFDPYSTAYTESVITIAMFVLLVAVLVTAISFTLSCLIYSAVKSVIAAKLQKYVHFKTMHVAYRNFYVVVGTLFCAILCYCIFNAVEITYLSETTLGTMQSVLHSLDWLSGVEPALENCQSEITTAVLELEQQCSEGKSIVASLNAGLDEYFSQVQDAARQLASAAAVAGNFTAQVNDILPRVEVTIVAIPLVFLTMITLSICQLCPCIWGSRFRCQKNVFTVVFMGGATICLPIAVLAACYTAMATFAVDACANGTNSLANAVPNKYSDYVDFYLSCGPNGTAAAQQGASNMFQWKQAINAALDTVENALLDLNSYQSLCGDSAPVERLNVVLHNYADELQQLNNVLNCTGNSEYIDTTAKMICDDLSLIVSDGAVAQWAVCIFNGLWVSEIIYRCLMLKLVDQAQRHAKTKEADYDDTGNQSEEWSDYDSNTEPGSSSDENHANHSFAGAGGDQRGIRNHRRAQQHFRRSRQRRHSLDSPQSYANGLHGRLLGPCSSDCEGECGSCEGLGAHRHRGRGHFSPHRRSRWSHRRELHDVATARFVGHVVALHDCDLDEAEYASLPEAPVVNARRNMRAGQLATTASRYMTSSRRRTNDRRPPIADHAAAANTRALESECDLVSEDVGSNTSFLSVHEPVAADTMGVFSTADELASANSRAPESDSHLVLEDLQSIGSVLSSDEDEAATLDSVDGVGDSSSEVPGPHAVHECDMVGAHPPRFAESSAADLGHDLTLDTPESAPRSAGENYQLANLNFSSGDEGSEQQNLEQ